YTTLFRSGAETENVRACIKQLAMRLLRGHVGNGPHDRAGSARQPGCGNHARCFAIFTGVAGELCQAKVEHLYLTFFRDDDVRGFDIAVDDATRMRLCER